jgi:hypothetical protein
MDFTVDLSIQIVNNQGNATRFIVTPINGIGIPGGVWVNRTLDSYGTKGRSPVCSDAPAAGVQYPGFNRIHVRSTSVLNYTLRDFFNVWGQPLGKNGNDTTFDSAYIQKRPGYVWEMCIGNPTNTPGLRLGSWIYEQLTPGKFITIVYYNQNSSYPGCIG